MTTTWIDRMNAIVSGQVPLPPVAVRVGFRLVSVEADRATCELEALPEQHGNSSGTVQGGILCAVADAAMGSAWASGLRQDESFTTVELKINFLKPAKRGRLVAQAQVVKRGGQVGMVECDIVDAEGALIARTSCTCMTLHGR